MTSTPMPKTPKQAELQSKQARPERGRRTGLRQATPRRLPEQWPPLHLVTLLPLFADNAAFTAFTEVKSGYP